MRALWLADVLRAAGLSVVEMPGWQTRGKELDAIEGVVSHHTASPPNSTLAANLNVVTNGNGIAPGPIAQLLLGRDGTWYVIASGKANHAGAGGPWGWLPYSPPGQLSTANARTIGIEAINSGIGEPWAAAMVISYEIGCAALLKRIGVGVDRLLTHHEWAPTRKIDPAGPTSGRVKTLPKSQTWDGDAWRALVAKWMQPPEPEPLPPTPIPSEDDDVKYLHVTCPGNPEVLYAFDGSGAHLIGFSSTQDRDKLVAAYNAPTVEVSPGQYAELVARAS